MIFSSRQRASWFFAGAILLTCLVYWPGLSGSWFFDDYPNIVNNPDMQPARLGFAELVTAALSSPASDFGRPLASLSFVANHAVNGLEPFGWKFVNLVIHLLNGWLVFLLARTLFVAAALRDRAVPRSELTAALIAAGWLLLPINLTAVLFVVQRMESLANVFVLLGLLGYVRGRLRMLAGEARGLGLCVASVILPTVLGLLAKETAVTLPLYAFLVEWLLFGFGENVGRKDRRLFVLFGLILLLPAVLGLAWLLPGLLRPATWAARDFTLATRLLSEARIVVDYIGWSLLPLPQSLSFYHDHFDISQGLLTPWTTLVSLLAILTLLTLAWWLRRRRPLVSLGISLFFGCHLLTGTVLPLELIYEHRNYFASFGLLLAVVPLLTAPTPAPALARHALLGLLLVWWGGLTLLTARAWGDPLRLAADLAIRAPESPRAQFGFGHEMLKHSGYDPASPQVKQAYSALERASSMPHSSILPEQTMILTSTLMRQPVEARWWESLITKLVNHAPNSEDVDALGALTRCAGNKDCEFPRERMDRAFSAATSHPRRNAKLLTIHGDWAWSVLGERELGERLADAAVHAKPSDPDARITLARMNLVLGNPDKAREQLRALERLNMGRRLDRPIAELRRLLANPMPTR